MRKDSKTLLISSMQTNFTQNRKQTCEIKWLKDLDDPAWIQDFNHIPESNLLQAPSYALIAATNDKMRTRRAYIHLDGKKAGLLQIFEQATLFGLFHVIAIDRGPLWFEGFGGAADWEVFFRTFDQLYPKRKGRKRRLMPEMQDGFAAKAIIKQVGIQANENFQPYETLWLDLTKDRETLWNNLDGIWRNNIRRAEKAGIHIEYDTKGKYLDWLLQYYKAEKEQKSYKGASTKTVTSLFHAFKDNDKFLIIRALHKGRPIAAINIIKHGASATYQIACRADKKSKLSIHHYMLWHAILHLKECGTDTLDLGGINREMPSGLIRFKRGSGAKPYKLIGHYD